DRQGDVVEAKPVPQLSESAIRAAFEKFRGDFYQIPPMVSAKKHAGVPLYKLARQGKVVEREPRFVRVYRYTIDRIGLPEIDLDRQGDVVEAKPVPQLSESAIRAAFEKFRGDFYQIPPMVSAKKHAGVPLYKLARQGKVVEREPRFVRVYRYTIDRIGLPEID